MSKKHYSKQDILGIQERERQRAEWAWRVRRLVALKLSWFRQCVRLDISEEEKGRRLHANEIAQRSVRADLWRATPDCTRWMGEGKYRSPLHKDVDRHQAVIRLEAEAGELFGVMCRVRTDRYRRRKGLPPIDHDADVVPFEPKQTFGPYDVDLDDLGHLLGLPFDAMIQELETKKVESRSPGGRYKPGQVPQAPVSQEKPAHQGPPKPPQAAPGRPRPPQPVEQTYQGALDVEIPFGKYRGCTVGDLLEDDEGLSYLWWLANQAEITSNRFHDAVAVVYDMHSDEAEQARRGSWRR